MAQTVVEWLVSEIQRYNDSGYEFHPKYNEEIIEQAKEMERLQIINAYDLGSLSEMQYPNPETIIENGEQYYNETFKSE